MFRQLQTVALNVALGVVSERPYVKRVQNPYAHFGRPDLWTEGFRRNNQRFIHNHIYRICEVRPPSIEKVKIFSHVKWVWPSGGSQFRKRVASLMETTSFRNHTTIGTGISCLFTHTENNHFLFNLSIPVALFFAEKQWVLSGQGALQNN